MIGWVGIWRLQGLSLTSSSVLPRVSVSQVAMYRHARQKAPYTKKAPYPIASMSTGERSPMKKFPSQFAIVVSPLAYTRGIPLTGRAANVGSRWHVQRREIGIDMCRDGNWALGDPPLANQDVDYS